MPKLPPKLVLMLLAAAGLLIAAALFLHPTPAPAPQLAPLSHGVYVWQRRWSSSIGEAVDTLNSEVSGWYVLAAQYDTNGWFTNEVPWQSFATTQRQLTAVFRVEGSGATPWPSDLSERITAVLSTIRAQGLQDVAVQIDFDCATARLPAYVSDLRALRAALGAVPLSITGLPAWLDDPAAEQLAAAADLMVWQLHNVDRPSEGIFDAARALQWIGRIAALEQPFAVSLPTYSLQVRTDADGTLTAAAGENVLGSAPEETTATLHTDAYAMESFLHTLATTRPATLQTLLWFRLPLPEDRNNWPLSVLQQLLSGAPLQSQLAWSLTAGDSPGLYDVWLQATGVRPSSNVVGHLHGARCDLGDGVRGAVFNAALQEFTLPAVEWNSEEPQRIGWLRCNDNGEVHVD